MSDHYVECAECGHPIEHHGKEGCGYAAEGCTCRSSWSRSYIEDVRRRAGLPARYRAADI